jgi:hypothetical protein
VLKCFPVRLLEGMSVSGAAGWIMAPNFFIQRRIEDLTLGLVHQSTISDAWDEARNGEAVTNVPLEYGHVPDVQERISPYLLPAEMGALCALGSTPWSATRPTMLAQAAILAHIGLGAIDEMTGARLSDHPLGLLVNARSGLLRGRNRTMAKNIVRYLDHGRAEPVLAIVGGMHVHGIGRLLEGQGFERIEL